MEIVPAPTPTFLPKVVSWREISYSEMNNYTMKKNLKKRKKKSVVDI